MTDNSLAYALARRSYAQTLVGLLRVCSDLNKGALARLCGVSNGLITQWVNGTRPIAPPHERRLRQRLTEALRAQRATLTALEDVALVQLQGALVQALVDLDGAVLAITKAYTACVRTEATPPAAGSPAVFDPLKEVNRPGRDDHVPIPGLWQALAIRKRGLRTIIGPTEDIRANVHDLLIFAQTVYGLAPDEPMERKGPRHRHRGRPRKSQV